MKQYSRLKTLREDADMTQAEVGSKLNISQRSYVHFEAGTRGIPLETLIALADLYKVNPDYLVERTGKKEMLPRKHN